MRMENDLGRDPVRRLVLRIALPSMLAQFVSVLYSVVDRMYIGNIPGVGELALAGAGVCGPLVTMIGSVAFWVGVGGSPLVSVAMGRGDGAAAKKVLANCFVLLCALGLALTGAAWLTRRSVLLLFGASGASLPYAMDYYSVYLTGTLLALLSTGMNQFIICQGFAKKGMLSVLLGAVLNIVLDPVFIFALDMGVAGAALATVLSQLASCLYVLAFLFGRTPPVRVTFGGYSLRVMGRVLATGFTPFLIIAFDNVMILALNALLQHYGGAAQGDSLVAAATIAQSFMLVVTMPLGGITGGTGAILGYNYGAGQPRRILEAQKWILLLCIGYAGLLTALGQLAPGAFVAVFARGSAAAPLAVQAIRICTLGLVPMAVQYTIVDGFTGMGMMQYSLPISFFRKAVYFVSLFWLPAHFGAMAIFAAEPISDFVGPAFAAFVYWRRIRYVVGLPKERA